MKLPSAVFVIAYVIEMFANKCTDSFVNQHFKQRCAFIYLIYLVCAYFRAPCDHSMPSTKTNPDIQRRIPGERTTRINNSGNNSVDKRRRRRRRNPAPQAGQSFRPSVRQRNKRDQVITFTHYLIEQDEQRGGEWAVQTAKHAGQSSPIQQTAQVGRCQQVSVPKMYA